MIVYGVSFSRPWELGIKWIDNTIKVNSLRNVMSVKRREIFMPRVKCPSRGQDIMAAPITEQNKRKCPSCGQDIMAAPITEQNKRKCPSCGQDIMAAPITEENKRKCPSCGQDIMAAPTIE
jgi:ribosomal protein S27AE